MAFTSAKMGLKIWNLLTDLYDHTQLADNWAKVDYHDHSPGKGVQIPTEGIADAAITGAKLASNLDPTGAYTTYKRLQTGSTQLNSGVTSQAYAMSELGLSGALATAHYPGIFYVDPVDYSALGRITKMRIVGSLAVLSATAPAANYTVALQPITAITAAVLTPGAAVTGSGVTVTAPLGNTLNAITGTDFDFPAAGFYMLTVTPSTTTSAGVFVRAGLGVRQV